MTVQLNEMEFLKEIDAIFGRINEVNDGITDEISDDLRLRVIANILLGYVTLGWAPTSPSYRDYRMKRGLPPITMGHTLDEQLSNSVMKNKGKGKDFAEATIFIPHLEPNGYEVQQEFGFISRSGKMVPERPYFRPAIDEVADKFIDKVKEAYERAI